MGRVWCHLMSAQRWKHHTCNTAKVTTVPLAEIHTIIQFSHSRFSLLIIFLSHKDPTDLWLQTWYVLGYGGQPQDWPLVPYLRGNWDFLWDRKCINLSTWNLSSPTCPNFVLKKNCANLGNPKFARLGTQRYFFGELGTVLVLWIWGPYFDSGLSTTYL